MTFRSPKLLSSSRDQVCVRCGKTHGVVWRPFPGFEAFYEISDRGECRSIRTQYFITPNLCGKGRRYAQFQLHINGKRHLVYAHHAVLIAFVGNRPSEDSEACHGPLGSLHNCPDNLRWGSRNSNIADIVVAGSQRGHRNPAARLTDESIREIRLRRSNGEPVDLIARDFGISRDYIYTIAARKAWSHVS